MTMAPLDELFPDLARSESRSITVMDYDCLPPGPYLLRAQKDRAFRVSCQSGHRSAWSRKR